VRAGEGTPRYVVTGSGPDHDRAYMAEVFVAGKLWGTGEGRSKKDAEQEAARTAWDELSRVALIEPDDEVEVEVEVEGSSEVDDA
jgi:ribonuclease-3